MGKSSGIQELFINRIYIAEVFEDEMYTMIFIIKELSHAVDNQSFVHDKNKLKKSP